MNLPFLLCAAITSVSACISLGFSIAAVRSAAGEARTLALYSFARSVALALFAIASSAVFSVSWLEAAACCMIVVQAIDAAIGVAIKDRMKTFGPAFTAVFNLAGLIWMLAR
jgi:hypothetical protein